jgi:hypothetical protein
MFLVTGQDAANALLFRYWGLGNPTYDNGVKSGTVEIPLRLALLTASRCRYSR